MASRAVDLLIAYRVIKLLVTPFKNQAAFKTGIIDADGKVLKPVGWKAPQLSQFIDK